MKFIWSEIKREHILEAIRQYDEHKEDIVCRNLMLKHENRLYPAKYIRAMAYKIVHGDDISVTGFCGGKETIMFFHMLGFETIHKKIRQNRNFNINYGKPKYREIIEQKNLLRKYLKVLFKGDIVSEKTFQWLKTPAHIGEYSVYYPIVNALTGYRGSNNIGKSNYRLRCDFVCEGQKLIIEYDDYLHFNTARKITLENYPANIKLGYSKEKWIYYCGENKIKDNNFKNRDEIRAFYDTVIDIESVRNNYIIIRIRHGDIDCRNEGCINEIYAYLKAGGNLKE